MSSYMYENRKNFFPPFLGIIVIFRGNVLQNSSVFWLEDAFLTAAIRWFVVSSAPRPLYPREMINGIR